MHEDFDSAEKILREQFTRCDILRDDLLALTSSSYHPDRTELRGSLLHETPKFYFGTDILTSSEDESDRQLLLIQHAVEQLRTTVLLIEAQNALARKREKFYPGLAECLTEDKDAFDKTMAYLTGIVSGSGLQGKAIDGQSLVNLQLSLEAEFREVSVGLITRTFQAMKPAALIEKIYGLRKDYAELASENTHLAISRIEAQFEDAVHFKSSLVRRLVLPEREAFVRKLVADKVEDCYDGLSKVYPEILNIKAYLGRLFEMSESPDFNPDRYEPASVLKISPN